MFQWLVHVGEHCWELSSIFKYEFCSFPSALFESSSLPLQANKPVLANALEIHPWITTAAKWRCLICSWWWRTTASPTMASRIHIWCCVKCIYSSETKLFLFFDGYTNELSTKDAIHLIRTGTCSGVTVHFTGDMLLQSKKDEFLANKKNKQRFFNQRTREYRMCWTVPSRMLMSW